MLDIEGWRTADELKVMWKGCEDIICNNEC